MVVSRLITMLVLRHVVVVHDRRLLRQGALIGSLMFSVWRRGWRQGALVPLGVNGERVLVLVDEALRSVVVDGAGGHRVELVVGNGRATFDGDAVKLIDLFLASSS